MWQIGSEAGTQKCGRKIGICHSKGQLTSKGLFGVFNSSKHEQKNEKNQSNSTMILRFE